MKGKQPSRITPPEFCRRGRSTLSDPDSRVMRTQGTPPTAGLQRADHRQRAADHPRRRDHCRRARTSRTWSRCSRRRSRQLARHGVERAARGGPGRRRLLAYRADARDRRAGDRGAGPARRNHARGETPWLGARPLRADARASCPPRTARSSTPSARKPSSRSTGRSNTTGGSTGSCEEAGPPRSRSGG